ncbi:unnamed protein product [Arctogadus glacialis]
MFCSSHGQSHCASNGAYPVCKGCSVCSRDNGCVSCQPKLFLFLRRERMRQYGECLHDCPSGYYGMRSPEINMCSNGPQSKPPHAASLEEIHMPPPPSRFATADPSTQVDRGSGPFA